MDDNSTSVTSKEDVQDISLKNWLKNKKTIVLLIFTALTNVGNVLSTIDIITDKTSSFYTWLGESKKFEGHWTNNNIRDAFRTNKKGYRKELRRGKNTRCRPGCIN